MVFRTLTGYLFKIMAILSAIPAVIVLLVGIGLMGVGSMSSFGIIGSFVGGSVIASGIVGLLIALWEWKIGDWLLE